MSKAFTQKQLALIEVANETGSFFGHHHHAHHHDHNPKQVKIPDKLTTNLGLYALKKLNAIDPTMLKVKEARLLQPVLPGVFTNGINVLFHSCIGIYTYYLWRTRGLTGFITIGVLPIAGLFVGRTVFNEISSYSRDFLYSVQRKQLVQNYKQRFGEKYLLSVLDPNFRLQ